MKTRFRPTGPSRCFALDGVEYWPGDDGWIEAPTDAVADAMQAAGLLPEVAVKQPRDATRAMGVTEDGRVLVSGVGPVFGLVPSRGIITAVILGSSDDQHCYCNAEGNLVVSGGVGVWTSNEGDHLLQSDVLVSLNKDSPLTDFQNRRATVRAKRVSATALQMALPGWPDGSGLMDLHMLSAFAQPSWVRKLVSLANGAIRIVGTMAVGGEQTVRKVAYHAEILSMQGVQMVIGAFGIGNDILSAQDIPAETTVANVTAMVKTYAAAGLLVCIRMPPATASMTTAQQAKGRKIMDALESLRARTAGLFLVDEYGVTINPSTGQGKANLFIGDGVHMNRLGKDAVAAQAYVALSSILANPVSRLIASLTDCKRSEPNNQQAMDGFWLATGVTASTLNAKATGTVDAAITAIAVGGNGAALACSLEARADGFGYDQVLTFTPGGNNQSFQITMTGPAGFEFWRNLEARDYDVMCVLSLTPDSGLEINGYGQYITATINGASGRITESMRTENGVSNEPGLTVAVTESPCIFPPARLGAVPTAATWVLGVNTGQRGTAGNKVVVRLGRPTIRPSIT